MAAILRSGKFLRLVTGIARQNQTPSASAVNPSNPPHPEATLQAPADTHSQFHTWSLHQLQSALPILSSAASQDQQDDAKAAASPGIIHDPLKEFLLDQQSISESSNKLKTDSGGLAIGHLKGEAKRFLRKSVRSEVVGFDAIREEEETRELSSVALKAVVAAKKSPAKEKPSIEPVTAKFEASVSTVEPADTSKSQVVADSSTQTETSESPMVLPERSEAERPDDFAQPISSMQDFVVLDASNHQQEQLAAVVPTFEGNVTENQLIPPQALVPMVPVVEGQVTQWYPLHVVCSMLRDQGRVLDLENLLWGSTGIRREDRKLVFMWTLQCYVDMGMLDRAVMLSKRLEWEGLAQDFPEFHNLMGSLIQNYSYRLVVPPQSSPSVSMSISPAVTPYASCPSTPVSSNAEEQLAIQAHYHRKLKRAIAKENGAEGIAALNELDKSGKQINVTELSSLIEILVKDELLLDATNVTESMLRRDTYPMPKIFRFLLNRLAATGQVEMMNTIGQYLTTGVKKEVSFDNRLCNAYLAAGRGAEYLDALEQELDSVAGRCKEDAAVQVLKDKFPRGGAMGLLESDPNLVDQYTRLAHKFLNFGFVAPVNVLWTYHFINGRYDVAEKLWHSHVKSCPQIMFQKVCQTARTTGNAELAWRLVDLLHNATVTQGARGIAYSCLIDVLTQRGSFAEGCEALRSALASGVQLCDINRTALKRLKEGLESNGLQFPYDIPKKVDTPSECGDSESSMALACI